MTIIAYDTNTITTDGTEQTIKSITAVGEFALGIDFAAMASLDVVLLKTYKIIRASGTKRLLYPPVMLSGAPSDATGSALLSQWIPNDLSDANSIQFTITRIAGTDRAYPWKVYQRNDVVASVTGNVGGNVVGSVASVTAGVTPADGSITAAKIATGAIDADSLATDAVTEIVNAMIAAIANTDDVASAIWNFFTANATLSGSLGKLLVDNLNATVSSRASQTSVDTIDDFLDTEIAAIKAKTDSLTFTVANQIDANVVDWKGVVAPAMTGDAFARLGAPAGVSVSADIAAIEAQTDDIGVAGAGLTALGDTRLANLNATVSSRASQTSVDAVDDFVDTEVAAIKAKTDQLTFSVINQLDANVIDWKGATAPAMTGDAFARLGAPAGASVSADVAAVKTDTGNILTKLLKYIQLVLRKDSAIATDNATELTAINANGGSGAGAYANTTDAQEALSDTLLKPTVAGRALDVSAGGEAGIDLANIGSPTTVVNLSGLTVKTATDVEADTQDMQARLPAALIGGRMNSDLEAVNGNTAVITAFLAALGVQTTGAAVSGTLTTTTFSTNLTTPTANAWYRHSIIFTSGTLAKHVRVITNYVVASGVITVDEPFASAPANGDTFIII